MSLSPALSDTSSATMASQNDPPLLGKHAQALIACNQKLQELGIDRTISLPQICVIGDQSTGKSSLIESISTIKVPKAKGCCTQCPVAIHLSSGVDASSPWTCTVSIEQHYDFDKSLVSAGVTKKNSFGPWQKRTEMKKITVKTTTDKNEVPLLITAAQSAILNPDTHAQDWLQRSIGRGQDDESNTSAYNFSPNVVRIDVSEGNWGNLSFIDLPGVIVNTKKEGDRWLVKLIENLVKAYATADKSINMLCLPMIHDIENSRALAIIQDLKAQSRTLAVFTKADLAESDQREQFLRKFVGQDHLEFKHGYNFVVMQDNVELEDAREFENNVFSQSPWSLLDRKAKSKLGMNNLSKFLRQILFEKTREALPGNLESIEGRLNAVVAELAVLPAPPKPAIMLMQLHHTVTTFGTAMSSLFSGDAAGDGMLTRTLWTKNNAHFRKTQSDRRTAEAQSADLGDVVELSSDNESVPSIPVKAEKSDEEKFDPVHRFRLEEIRRVNERYYQANVPGEIELRAVEELNKLSVKGWDTLLKHFMDANSDLLFSQVEKVIQERFGCYRHLDLYKVISDHVKTYIGGMLEREREIGNEVCRLERNFPLTLDGPTLKDKENKCLFNRKLKRTKRRLDLFLAEQEVTEGVKPKRKIDEKELGPDDYETELIMSAKTRAYYEVASTRFVDNICLGILGRLLPACTTALVEDLQNYIGLPDDTKHAQIIKWMTEDPEREAKRQQLVYEQTRLTEGLKYIEDVLGDSTASPSKRPYHADSNENEEFHESPTKRVVTNRSRENEIDQEDTEMYD